MQADEQTTSTVNTSGAKYQIRDNFPASEVKRQILVSHSQHLKHARARLPKCLWSCWVVCLHNKACINELMSSLLCAILQPTSNQNTCSQKLYLTKKCCRSLLGNRHVLKCETRHWKYSTWSCGFTDYYTSLLSCISNGSNCFVMKFLAKTEWRLHWWNHIKLHPFSSHFWASVKITSQYWTSTLGGHLWRSNQQ